MRRPADCVEDVREWRMRERSPATVAFGDQLAARAQETFREVTANVGLPHAAKFQGEHAMAFQFAATVALEDRMNEPSGRMCEHMTDLQIPHVVELSMGFVACERCAPAMGILCQDWDAGCCDVCGEESGVFRPMTFTLGSGVAFANVCPVCWGFLEVSEQA